ncbi:MAG: BON domain-containing protein [Chthoniobacterales bacterium]
MRKKIRLTFATAAVLVLLPNLLLTGCSHESAERSAAEQQEDLKLVEQVKATFSTSNSFKFPDVQVAAFRKTVQLSGFVVSDDQKQAAENLAKNVPGVQAVENKVSEKR